MLSRGSEDGEKEVKGVLEQDGQMRDRRGAGARRGEGFDCRPEQVDVEEQQEDSEASDGWLFFDMCERVEGSEKSGEEKRRGGRGKIRGGLYDVLNLLWDMLGGGLEGNREGDGEKRKGKRGGRGRFLHQARRSHGRGG